MKIRNAAFFTAIATMFASAAGGCLELKTANTETTGGHGGSAGNGPGGAGGMSTSSSSGGDAMSTSSSSGQMGGSGGSGAGGACVDGMVMSCYPGPVGTQSKGTCSAGNMNCVGGMWSDCNGAVWPTVESCDVALDVNCDGRTSCQGVPDSSATLGTNDDDAVVALAGGLGAYGIEGNIYGGGYRNATVDADGLPTSAQVLLVKRDPTGNLTDLSDRFNIDPSGHAWARGIGVDSKENLIVGGVYETASLSINNQGLKTPVAGATYAFLASFDITGNLVFAKQFGTDGITEIKDVDIDDSGNIYICGRFNSSIDFGGNVVMANNGFDGFVASYTATGSLRWKQIWSGNGDQNVDSVAANEVGKVHAGASFTSTVNVGGGAVLTADGGIDGLITALNASTGAVQWQNQLGGGGDVAIPDIVSRNGNVAFVALMRGATDIGGMAYMGADVAPAWDTLVATLEPQGGAVVSTFPFIASGTQVGLGISQDSFGDIALTGFFTSTLPLNGKFPDLTSSPVDVNAFVLKFDSKLNLRWAHGYGNSLAQAFTDVLIDPVTGHTFIGGGFQGLLLNFGLVTPQSTAGYDAIIGRMTN